MKKTQNDPFWTELPFVAGFQDFVSGFKDDDCYTHEFTDSIECTGVSVTATLYLNDYDKMKIVVVSADNGYTKRRILSTDHVSGCLLTELHLNAPKSVLNGALEHLAVLALNNDDLDSVQIFDDSEEEGA